MVGEKERHSESYTFFALVVKIIYVNYMYLL